MSEVNKFQEALNEFWKLIQEKLPNDSSNFRFYEWQLDILKELIDKQRRIDEHHKEIYEMYHHGTKQELEGLTADLIYCIEIDWSDEE